METRTPDLRVVAVAADREPVDRSALTDDVGDLTLTLSILVVGLVPLACELAHVGHWGAASLGLGTGGALFAVGALWSRLAAWRAERG